jgi:lysozyme family protein
VKDFEEALGIILEVEGGFVNDPDDRGGATNMGVTQGTYDAWLTAKGQTTSPVRNITNEEVAAIYKERYWDAVGADTLPWPVSLVMFDMAVNHGVAGANRILQDALQVETDGIVGPITRGEMMHTRPDSLANEVLWSRVEKYRRLSVGTQKKFLPGWLWRIAHLRRSGGLEGQIDQVLADE